MPTAETLSDAPAPTSHRYLPVTAILVGAAVAASPLTGTARLGPALAGGALAGAGFFAWRRRRPAPPAGPPLPGLAWFALLLGAAVLLPTAWHLAAWYSDSIWLNAHGMLLPLVLAALGARALRAHAAEPPESSPWGYPLLVAGLALIVVDAGVRTLHASVLGITAALWGASLLLLGPRRTRSLRLPLVLSLFLLPLPTSLASYTGLQTASTIGAEWILDAIGTPVQRFSVALQVRENTYAVSANCSGFSAFYAGVAAALVLGAHSGSWLRATALLAAVWPLTVIANSLREAALILICEIGGIHLLHSPLHGISGIAAVIGVLAGLALLAGRPALRRTLA